ncbi:Zn-ribbon RNA-binding protein, partial [Methanosarcina mazei]
MSSDKVEYCTSCGIRLVEKGYVKFPCPQCGAEIGRCTSCRQQGNVYTLSLIHISEPTRLLSISYAV